MTTARNGIAQLQHGRFVRSPSVIRDVRIRRYYPYCQVKQAWSRIILIVGRASAFICRIRSLFTAVSHGYLPGIRLTTTINAKTSEVDV
ncbi:TPA: hypothetical protein ACHIE0_003857 [Escherichia coli]